MGMALHEGCKSYCSGYTSGCRRFPFLMSIPIKLKIETDASDDFVQSSSAEEPLKTGMAYESH